MAVCEVCRNDYEPVFKVRAPGRAVYVLDRIGCAARKTAPTCVDCRWSALGHGRGADGQFCRGARSARAKVPPRSQLVDHVCAARAGRPERRGSSRYCGTLNFSTPDTSTPTTPSAHAASVCRLPARPLQRETKPRIARVRADSGHAGGPVTGAGEEPARAPHDPRQDLDVLLEGRAR